MLAELSQRAHRREEASGMLRKGVVATTLRDYSREYQREVGEIAMAGQSRFCMMVANRLELELNARPYSA